MVDANHRAQLNVCIIGGGPTGLAHIKILAEYNINVVCYESNLQVGGIWLFDKNNRGNQPMYCDLCTNIPAEQMQYSDLVMHSRYNYPTQSTVQQYLIDYSTHFKLYQYIQFDTTVQYVTRDNKTKSYTVTSYNKSTQHTSKQQFDAVIVANGHFQIPSYPDFIDNTMIHSNDPNQAYIIHSINYYKASQFTNQRVLVIGGSHSGVDIANQIASVATHVSVSLKTNVQNHFDGSVKATFDQVAHIIASKDSVINNIDKLNRCGRVQSIDINTKQVKFIDGTVHTYDSIICATGYKYQFDFLDDTVKPNVIDNRIEYMYQHLFDAAHTYDGSLAFPGITVRIVPFPMAEVQANIIALVLLQRIKLPSKHQMIDWCNALYDSMKLQNRPERFTHFVQFHQYVQSLIDWMDTDPNRQYQYTIYDDRRIRRVKR